MADFELGTLSTKLSSSTELLNNPNVTGSGAPAHTPHLASQKYVDVATGTIYEWWGGAWH